MKIKAMKIPKLLATEPAYKIMKELEHSLHERNKKDRAVVPKT